MITVSFEYLVLVSICIMFCYAIYYSVFKRLTFFSLNRFFLLFSITACLVVPALHITIHSQLPVNAVHKQIATVNNGNFEKGIVHSIAPQPTAINWLLVGSIVYLLVCSVLLCRLFYNIFKIIYQAR